MYLPDVRKQQRDAANAWLKSCFRYQAEKIVRSASKLIGSADPKGNFNERCDGCCTEHFVEFLHLIHRKYHTPPAVL